MGVVAVIAVAFVFGFIGSMPLAGPVALLVFSRAIEAEIGEALRIALGAALVEGIYAAVAFFGFTTFLSRHSIVLPLSHGITAVVLLVIGVYFLFWTERSPRDRATQHDHRGSLFVGVTVSALNPTLLFTWSAAVAWLYSKQLAQMSSWMAAPFGVAAALGVAVWFALLVALVRRYEGRFPRRILTWTVRAMGLALVGLSVWSAVQLVQWILSS